VSPCAGPWRARRQGVADAAPVPLDVAAAFVLGKQGLAGAPAAPPADRDVTGAVHAAAGVYATAPTCYLSCAARLPGFRPTRFDAAHREGGVVLLRAMRGSAYAIPLDALPFVVGATAAPVRTAIARLVRAAGLPDAEYTVLADRIETALSGRPAATVPQIRALLGDGLPPRREALQYAVTLMAAEARLVRAERRGGWRSDSYGYARWADRFPAPLQPVEPALAKVSLARWYLRAFGPATREDLRWWAGWPARDATAALAGLASELTRVELVDPAEATAATV
jgi:Winged helix DNA-binding domain